MQNISQSYLRKKSSPMMNSRGQVGVIVSILLVTMLVSVLITVQVYYIPQWMKEREAEHMDEVANQIASLKYSLDLQASEQSESPLTNSITLGSKELPYFVSSRAFGSLHVLSPEASNFSVSISGSGMVSQLQTVTSDAGTITNILSLTSFDLVMEELADGDIYNATLYDANVSVTVWERSDLGNTYQINVTVIRGTSVLYDQPAVIGLMANTQNYTLNLLNDDYNLATDVLPSVPTPFNISFDTVPRGRFVVQSNRYQPTSVAYSQSFGTLKYESDNAYFVDQRYAYQGGSVILGQESGNSLLYPLLLTVSNDTRTLSMTMIDIEGISGKTAVSGYGTYPVRSNFSSASTYRCRGSSLTVNISTSYPVAWHTYLGNELEKSGMNHTITHGSTYVVVTLSDAEIMLERVVVYVQIGPGWIT
jgi:hypothetical protein